MDIQTKDGILLRNIPDGTPDEVIKARIEQIRGVQAAPEEKPQLGAQLNNAIDGVGRQLSLTGRHALEGAGDTLNLMASPIRGVMNLLPGVNVKPVDFSGMADSIGMEKPRNATERIVGDASRMVTAGGSILGAAGKAAPMLTGNAQKFAKLLASNPADQLASAASAGGAGSYVKETGGNEKAQLLASVLAGVAAPFATHGVSSLASKTSNALSKVPAATIDTRLEHAGIRLAELPHHVKNGLREDVAAALKVNPDLSPEAVRRLADYKLIGATPTAGTLTLDPAIVTQQKNLAKLGINSKDAAAQQLGRVENENNRQLIASLNNIGGATADDELVGGQKIIGALNAKNEAAKSAIGQAYTAARETNGRAISLDPHHFTNTANDLLDQALLGGKLPADVRNLLNNAATGKMPLTIDTAEQLKTRIGELQRASADGAERKALGLVRQALEDTPLLNDGAGMGKASVDAFNKARALNRSWMAKVEKTPALEAVRDGIEPDKFVQQFITGGSNKANLADVRALREAVADNPEALNAIKDQIAAHLKKAALNGAADEVGNFSQSSYNKALSAIGDYKLSMFFPKEELDQLKAIGRVASYEQFQPRGGAVNNSNTAGTALANILDRFGNSSILSKVPLANLVTEPAQNAALGMKAKAAMDTRKALARQLLKEKKAPPALLVSPALMMGNGE